MNAASSKTLPRLLALFFGYMLLNVGVVLMLHLASTYSGFEDDVGFLREKQAYLHLMVWKVAFYIHVFTSVLTLLAGFTQFSPALLKQRRSLHRQLGYLYVINVLFINVPSGFVMAIYANGLWSSKLAFLLLDCLWFWFTLKALMEAKAGNLMRHRDFMIRSYALTLSALTLRAWKVILIATTDLPPEVIYRLDAWLGFVPNLLLAEWLIASRKSATLSAERNHQREGQGDR